MNKLPANAGIDILKTLKTRLQEKGLRLECLSAYRRSATDELRGLLNGSRAPTIGNLAAIAESVWKLVQNPEHVGCDKEMRNSVKDFWSLFCDDLRKRFPLRLPNAIDCETLKNLLYCAFGITNIDTPPRSLISASLDLLVWRPDLHDCVSVREPGARPLRAGDGVRVEAKVTSGADAHLYLVWLTLEARQRLHAPFHPWNGQCARPSPGSVGAAAAPDRVTTEESRLWSAVQAAFPL